jgi:non-ribosomal peptide synthetase component F
LRVHGIRHHGRNSNPLTLLAAPGARMALTLLHDRQRWKERTILRMLEDLQTILTGFASAPEGSLGDLLARLEEQARRRLEAEGGELNAAARNRLHARLRQPREART